MSFLKLNYHLNLRYTEYFEVKAKLWTNILILCIKISVEGNSRIISQLVGYWVWGIKKQEGSHTGIIRSREPQTQPESLGKIFPGHINGKNKITRYPFTAILHIV